jgi:hypothetical protein
VIGSTAALEYVIVRGEPQPGQSSWEALEGRLERAWAAAVVMDAGDLEPLKERQFAQQPEIDLDRRQRLESSNPQIERPQAPEPRPVDGLDHHAHGFSGQATPIDHQHELPQCVNAQRRGGVAVV